MSPSKTTFRYSLAAYLLKQDDQAQTIGEMFRQLEEETGKLTFLERLWQYFSDLLQTVLNTQADFCDSIPIFRAYTDTITDCFNEFNPIQGCET